MLRHDTPTNSPALTCFHATVLDFANGKDTTHTDLLPDLGEVQIEHGLIYSEANAVLEVDQSTEKK